jgi:hypothetical protein
MNETRFDELAKAMSKETSRRGVLRIFAVGAAGGVLGALGIRGASTAEAVGPCTPLGNPCNTNPNDPAVLRCEHHVPVRRGHDRRPQRPLRLRAGLLRLQRDLHCQRAVLPDL